MRQLNRLSRRIYMLTLMMAVGGVPPSLADAQQAPAAAEPVCPASTPAPGVLALLAERFLKPGETFSLNGLSPEALKEIGAYQQQAAARQARDWPGLCQYAEKNAAVLKSGQRPHVIFMGDSITENWERADPALFSATTLGRGISGQTTPQMLLRMYPDVINLRPRIVHIMAGTNDISGNTGPESDQTIVDNIRAIVVLAKANGIVVVLGSITPSTGFVLRTGFNPASRIVRVNGLLERLAAEQHVQFVDYHTALTDTEGGMRAGLSNDGLHPNRNGYAVMRPLTERAIAEADRQRR